MVKPKTEKVAMDIQVIPLPVHPFMNKKSDTTYYNNPNLMAGKHTILDFKHYVHMHPIIENRWFFIEEAAARQGVYKNHEFLAAFIDKRADSVASKPPRFIRAKDYDPENPKPKIDEELTKNWESLNLTDMLHQFITKDQVHGKAIYYPFDKKALPKWYSGNPWVVYSDCEAIEDKSKRKDALMGHPQAWTVKTEFQEDLKLSVSNCVFFNSAQTIDFNGIPAGVCVWDDLIDYTFIKEAMKSFDQRLGNGFLIMALPATITPAQQTEIENRIRNVRTEMGLTYKTPPNWKDNIAKPEWMNPGGSTNFVEHLSKYEDMFTTGFKLPLRWLMGDPKGASESGQTDTSEIQAKLCEFFNRYVKFVKMVCRFHNWIQTEDEIVVLPNIGMNQSERQKAEVDQIKAITISQKVWLTDNEKRELDGYEKIEGGDELNKPQPFGMGNDPKNRMIDDEKKAKEAKQGEVGEIEKKSDHIRSIFKSTKIRDLASICGVATNTIQKIKTNLENSEPLSVKCDSLSLKSDSITDDVLETTGPFLSAAELKYEDFHGMDVRSPEAIEDWFKSNTPKELHIGITPSDDHNSPIPLEVLRDNSVGTLKALEFKDGKVQAKYRIALSRIDEILGKDNWVRDYIKDKKDLPLSVALWSKDKIKGDKRYNNQLDVRSVVLTRSPRNKQTFVKGE